MFCKGRPLSPMSAQDQPRTSRLLISDDDEKLVRLLRDYLEPFGYQVDTALDGREGLAKAIEGNYAAVILDVMLPGLNGFDVLRESGAERRPGTHCGGGLVDRSGSARRQRGRRAPHADPDRVRHSAVP